MGLINATHANYAWTSDGKKLISASYRLIRIFDTATWQQIAILQGHTHLVTAISLSRNNLASASLDRTARLWNLDTNLQVGPPLYHERDVPSAALSPDGNVLVTGCENKNAYTWDVHAILEEAGLEDPIPIGTNITPQDDLGIQHIPPSLSDKSFLEADATQYPGQFGAVQESSPTFFHGMEADIDSSTGDAPPHSSVNALLARLSSLLNHFRPENGELTELTQPSGPSVFHLHAFLTRLSSLVHSSPPEIDAPDRLQQPSTPLPVDPRVLLARLSSLLHRSRLNTAKEAEPRPTTPLSSRLDALITRLSSLFRSQPHTSEEIELTQPSSRPRVVEVAAVRDKQALIVARGPQYEKAKRAYEQQTQSHSQAQASSSHAQPAEASTSATPVPGTAATQSPPISWWAHIVLYLCCASPPHSNGH